MIAGVVRDDEARIRLKIRGPDRQEAAVEAVVDTGFTGALTLPTRVIDSLGLNWQKVERATLANGSECLLDVYEVWVVFDRRVARVLANEVDSGCLVGMTLLRGYEVNLKIRPDGKVTIRRLP